MKQRLQKYLPGFVVSGSGMGADSMEGPVEFLLAGLVGAMAGFILGLLSGSIARLITYNRDRGIIGGRVWAAYGASAGALALALMELFE